MFIVLFVFLLQLFFGNNFYYILRSTASHHKVPYCQKIIYTAERVYKYERKASTKNQLRKKDFNPTRQTIAICNIFQMLPAIAFFIKSKTIILYKGSPVRYKHFFDFWFLNLRVVWLCLMQGWRGMMLRGCFFF